MDILIMGAGAIGSVVGGFLAKAGHNVTLVGRAPHMTAIRDRGLRISGIWGEHRVESLQTRTDVAGLEPGGFEFILICVKSYHTRDAVAAVAPLADSNTLVCSYQNGLGNAETIAKAVGWPRTIGARAIFGTWLPEPGHAEVTVIANPTAVGVYDPATPAARVQDLAEAMDRAGLPTVYTDEIATVLWGKVAYNCALNPLSALLDVPYGALLETEHTRSIMREVVAELYAVGSVLGVRLRPDTAEGVRGSALQSSHSADGRALRQHARRLPAPAPHGDRCPERRHLRVRPGPPRALPDQHPADPPRSRPRTRPRRTDTVASPLSPPRNWSHLLHDRWRP
jgi:2-dehydropantoate 2-reductase